MKQYISWLWQTVCIGQGYKDDKINKRNKYKNKERRWSCLEKGTSLKLKVKGGKRSLQDIEEAGRGKMCKGWLEQGRSSLPIKIHCWC